MLKTTSPEMGQTFDKIDQGHKYSLVDQEGKRFFLEQTHWNRAVFDTGSYKVILEPPGNDQQKAFKVETEIGFYYPMQLQIPEPYKAQSISSRIIGDAWRMAKQLVDEYRDFKSLMEEVAE